MGTLFVLAKGLGVSKWRSKGRPHTPKHFSGARKHIQPYTGRDGPGVAPTASVSSQRGSQLPQTTRKSPPGLTQHNKTPQVPITPLLLKSANEWQFWSLPGASGSERLRQQKVVPTRHLCPDTGSELGTQMMLV